MHSGSDSLTGVSAVKLALMAKEARTQLGALARAEPIAVIGMGCRFPGGADSPESFWELLRNGVDAVGDIPPGRWNVAAFQDDDPSVPGKTSVTQGGFITDVDRFDAAYFGIIRREAEKMDPQHRLFLETAINALDHAGLPRESLAGSPTGVFVASYYTDYAGMQLADREWIDARTLTGTLQSVLSNRLSWLLDLRGPSLTVDTACSSSLVAVHLACQSLRSGESSIALAGGVSLMLSPELMITLDKVGFMSPSGRCRTLDAAADGFVRGEGCGVVVLKRLSDALSDGDRVLSVIRGSAVNQDGHSTVLAAPNGLAQQALVREALVHAQLTPGRVGLVEMHGTATPLGDPIEVEALAATVGAPRDDGSRCYLGSVKSNIGHLEAAAGIAGLIKATLVLQHGEIPRQVHFTKLNPHISLERSCLAVADQHRAWPAGSLPRVIGISGFGVGGTNAHVLLEEAPLLGANAEGDSAADGDTTCLLPLSAQSEPALHELASKWIPFLDSTPASFPTVCATAGVRRSHYAHRLAITGNSAAEMVTQLRGYVNGDDSMVAHRHRAGGSAARVAFVFSGQGSQWIGMGRELAASEPVFRDTMLDIDARFQALSGWSLRDALAMPEATSRVMETEVAQPAIFAMQVALAALWASWGVRPHAVVGHSVGELAALHVAGVLSLNDAVRIVYHRGRIMQRATGHGRMAAVALTAHDAAALAEQVGPELSLAAVNGPRSSVLSGTPDALRQALAQLEARHVSHKELPVSYAFHSAQMAPFEAELAAAIGPLTTQPARMAVYSTVTGRHIGHDEVDAKYLGRNVRATVQFAPAIDAMLGDSIDVLLEVAPHAVLAASLTECVTERGLDVPVLASLRRGRSERECMLRACGGVYVAGGSPTWDAVMPLHDLPVALPSYPWQRERFWLREFDRYATHAPKPAALSPLLGRAAIGKTNDVLQFDATWPVAPLQWLVEHRISGRAVMPAAAMLDVMRSACVEAGHGAHVTLSDFVVHAPLVLAEHDEPRYAWHTVVTRVGDTLRVDLRATDEAWLTEALPGRMVASAHIELRVELRVESRVESRDTVSVRNDALPIGSDWCTDTDTLYARFAAMGVSFGAAFRTVERWRLAADAAEAWLVAREPVSAGALASGVHPTVLDGALQLCVVALTSRDGKLPASILLPLGVESYTVLAPVPARVRAMVRVERENASGASVAHAQLLDADGNVVAVVRGARFAPADEDALAAMVRVDGAAQANTRASAETSATPDVLTSANAGVYTIGWRRTSMATAAGVHAAAGRWLVITNGGELGTAIVNAIRAHGGSCDTVRVGSQTAAASDGWTVAPTDDKGFATTFAAIAGAHESEHALPLRGIVHALSLDAITDVDGAAPDTDWMVTGSAMQAAQALAHLHIHVPLWLVTQEAQAVDGTVIHPQQAGLWGVANVVALEHTELSCRVVDLAGGSASAQASSLVRELVRNNDAHARIALRGDERYVPELHRYRASRIRNLSVPNDARLLPPQSGALDELRWTPALPSQPGAHDVRLRVQVAGVNFRDVLLSLGMYPGTDGVLGAECVGVVEAVGAEVHDLAPGDRVFGFAPGSLSSTVVVPAAFVSPLPLGVSDDQAAALPVAFLTAMLGLYRTAHIGERTRVLIHAAAGGVGLAAVQLAQRCGADVFATAGSAEKREYLTSLGVQHVFDSRSPSFADDVLAATDGKGVDVVLNSLAGEFIVAGVRVLSTNGWFLELGKRDIWSPQQMTRVRPDVRYRAYDLGDEAMHDRTLVRAMLDELRQWLADGSLRPLPVRAFEFGEAAEAFRFMAQARHIGKLVLRAPSKASDSPASIVHDGATYLITGGTGALGVRTARWLAEWGARSLVLTGRRAPGTDAMAIIEAVRAMGAQVHVRAVDAADATAMQALLDEMARTMPPLRGVVHAAGVVDDGVLLNYSWSRWREVLKSKAHGARVLDRLTQQLPLDFFVLYSSAGLHLGPLGQGPYAAANAELDALASSRRGRGLSALSVAWGQWPEAGMAVSMTSRGTDTWSARGMGWIEPSRAFAQLAQLLRDGASYAAIMPMKWEQFLSRLPAGLEADFFKAVLPSSSRSMHTTTAGTVSNNGTSLVERWRAQPASAWRHLVFTHVAERTRQVLGVDDAFVIDAEAPLRDVGLDSLMAVELRNVLTRSLGKSLPATLLFDFPTLDALSTYVQRTFHLLADVPASASSATSKAGDVIASLSDEEAEALLIAELDMPQPGGRS